MRHLFVFLTLTLAGLAQQAQPNVEATSSGVCSPNILSNEGPVRIVCNTAMDRATVTRIVSLLNRILRERGGSEEVNRKLDSIMEFLQTNVNPNKPVTTYDCAGTVSTTGRGVNTGMVINMEVGGPTEAAFQSMGALYNSHHYSELVTACAGQMKSAPGWLTPHLFCGLAHLAMGHMDEAKEALRHYDQRTGPAYDGDSRCKAMSDFLHFRLQL
jgi:hypothetical protein